jgi:hypothetical protein
LHGLMPDGLILCYEMGREVFFGMETIRLPPLEKVIEFYEAAANIMHPCRVVGVAVNGQKFSDDAVAAECDRVGRRLGLPACDVIRHGPQKLVDAVLGLRTGLQEATPVADCVANAGSSATGFAAPGLLGAWAPGKTMGVGPSRNHK